MVLSYKKLSYSVMTALMAAGGFYFYNINSRTRSSVAYSQGAAIGPEYFPNLLAVLLILMSLLGIYRTWQMEERKLEVPYAGQILLAAVASALLIGLWSIVGLFYPLAFLFVSGILYALRVQPGKRGVTATSSMLIAFVVTAVVYLAFDLLMSLRF